jgi:peptide/nickel transport system substrate-binding protein
VLDLKGKLIVGTLLFFIVGALFYWMGSFYVSLTKKVPAVGGGYTEGIVGQPRYLNPILSQTSAADRDLSQVLFSGLFGYDSEGNVVPRLAERYSVSDDGKEYTVTLRANAKWHDGSDVTVSDVLFTVNAIQDPAYKSPLRQNWQGIDIESKDDRTLVFTLKKPYFGFLEHLTVGILPKHIWETIPPERFVLADYNLVSPVGSGPYRYSDMKKDSNGNILSYDLRAFSPYFDGEPYITKLSFHFYESEDGLVAAFRKKEVMGMSPLSSAGNDGLKDWKGSENHGFFLPRVFAVFFNPVKSVPLAYAEVREALSRATDRDALVREVLHGEGVPAFSPLLPFMEDAPSPQAIAFDIDVANRLLEEKGWVKGDDGIRKKGEVRLEFDLAVPEWFDLRRTADILASQWAAIGVKANVKVLGVSDLSQSLIRPREYQALLYGEEMRLRPDYYSFWHSSQKTDPGLNLALFDDTAADDALTSLREELDPAKRKDLFSQFDQALGAKYPAVFLYSPKAFYVVSSQVKGMVLEKANDFSSRFSDLAHWYIDTKRIRK